MENLNTKNEETNSDSKFQEILSNQHDKRKKAIEKLRMSMFYFGMNSVLVIGDTGTGKTHWINKIVESYKHQSPYFEASIISRYGRLCGESKDYWEELFKVANGKVLVIEEVESLTLKNQDYLFDALSTTNGLYGFEEKEFSFILIFTSNFSIKKIRDDRRFLSAKFFDRISQFVIEFPNFGVTQARIFNDFQATWLKMDFDDTCPENVDLKKWLEIEADRMHGNFRDLDKIVVNWKMHRINGSDDESILPIVKDEFRNYLHNPKQGIYDDNIFMFAEDIEYQDILQDFKSKLKKWAISINDGHIKVAAKKLGVSHRTMERW